MTAVRIAFAILLLVHGVAHLVGFVVPWRLARLEDMPYRTTVLGGRVDLGPRGIRVFGLLYLAAALAFTVCAVAVGLGVQGSLRASAATSVVSLLLCALDWPETRWGIAMNIAVLGLATTVVPA